MKAKKFFKVKKSATKSQVDLVHLGTLIDLKLQLESMKPIYAMYDEVLQNLLNSGGIQDECLEVSHQGKRYLIDVVDGFAQKNTQWKSVAHRRFDVSIRKKG